MERRLLSAISLGLACLTGGCNVEPEPGPAYVHDLPRCDDQGRSAHTLAQDCAFAFGGQGFNPGNWLHVRFSKPGAQASGGAVVVDFYGGRAEPGVIRESNLKAYDYPFLRDVTGVSGYDVVVPVERSDGHQLLSVWGTNFLDDNQHHTRAYVHLGDIPVGRILNLDGELFVETASGFKGPWSLRLYRALPSGIEPLGTALAEGNGTRCQVSGEAAALLPDAKVKSICAVFSEQRDYYDDYGQPGHFGSTP
jgi:hypothetical protein